MNSLDIIIPLYNEEDKIPDMVSAFESFKNSVVDKLSVNFIFINDGSTDDSLKILKDLSWEKKYIKIVSLSKTFGFQNAIWAGINNSNADYTCIINPLLYESYSTVLDMYNKSLSGYDVIYGVTHDSFEIKSYKTILDKLLKQSPSVFDDFVFLSKTVVEVLKSLKGQRNYLHEALDSVGFKSCSIEYESDFASDNYNLFDYAGLVDFKIIIIYILAVLLLLLALFSLLKLNMLSATIFFTSFVIVLALGIIASYLSEKLESFKEKPNYIIKNKYNF